MIEVVVGHAFLGILTAKSPRSGELTSYRPDQRRCVCSSEQGSGDVEITSVKKK
jgi:hypothetical protein